MPWWPGDRIEQDKSLPNNSQRCCNSTLVHSRALHRCLLCAVATSSSSSTASCPTFSSMLAAPTLRNSAAAAGSFASAKISASSSLRHSISKSSDCPPRSRHYPPRCLPDITGPPRSRRPPRHAGRSTRTLRLQPFRVPNMKPRFRQAGSLN